MNHVGSHSNRGKWQAFSAGSKPTGAPNPFAIEMLSLHNIALPETLRSKSWDEFAQPAANAEGATVMDVIVTVCDNAAGEVCPIWPTHNGEAPRKLHWSFPDPAAAIGNSAAKRAAFQAVFTDIRTRIDAFLLETK